MLLILIDLCTCEFLFVLQLCLGDLYEKLVCAN